MNDDPLITRVEFYDLSSGVVTETKLKRPRTENELRAVATQINAENKYGEKGSVDIAGRNFMLVHDAKVSNQFVRILNELP